MNTGEAAVQIETNMTTRVSSWNNLNNLHNNNGNNNMNGSYLGGGGGGGMSSFPSTHMIGVNTGFQGQLTSALVNATVMSFQGNYDLKTADGLRAAILMTVEYSESVELLRQVGRWVFRSTNHPDNHSVNCSQSMIDDQSIVGRSIDQY